MVLGYLKAQKAACTLKNKVQAAFYFGALFWHSLPIHEVGRIFVSACG